MNWLKRAACGIGIHDWRRAGKIRTITGNYSTGGGWAHWTSYEQRLLRCEVCGKEVWETFNSVGHNSNLSSDYNWVREEIRKREGVN